MMGGMRPGIILLREGTDTSQVSAGCNAMARRGGGIVVCRHIIPTASFFVVIFNAVYTFITNSTTIRLFMHPFIHSFIQ